VTSRTDSRPEKKGYFKGMIPKEANRSARKRKREKVGNPDPNPNLDREAMQQSAKTVRRK